MANDYNNKKYYWIKLRDTFMTSDAVDFLMAQKDGANYVVLYQMLCLKTVNTGGELSRTIGEIIIPYDIDKIVRDVKWFSKDTVIVALDLYKKLHLIFKNENDILTIANYEKMVGSETQNAIYKQEKKQLENFQLNSNRYKDIKILDIKNKDIIINDIINYMNNVLNTNYKSTTDSTKRFIRARLNEGFTLEQFKKVIDKKYNEWGQDKTMAKFLRPETLFGTKFESYLNQQDKNKAITPEWLGKDIESTVDKTENKEFKKFVEEFRKE